MMEDKKSKNSFKIYFIIVSIIITLLLLFIIEKQHEKNNDLNNEISRLTSQIETSRNTELEDEIDEERSQIDWEEYPEDICKDMEKIGLTDRYGILLNDDDNDNEKNWRVKTLWSYYKNGYRNEDFLCQYSEGDSTKIIDSECNYPQYQQDSRWKDNSIYKYTSKIIYKIATLHEDLYANHNREIKSETEQRREEEKLENILNNGKIDERVAYQWNNLKDLKEQITQMMKIQ